jgi:hypothetical protein
VFAAAYEGLEGAGDPEPSVGQKLEVLGFRFGLTVVSHVTVGICLYYHQHSLTFHIYITRILIHMCSHKGYDLWGRLLK